MRDADLSSPVPRATRRTSIAAIFAQKLSPETKTIVRTTEREYLELWRERELDVDFVVSSELETAHAVSSIIGVPAARQTDVFADGQVQIVEFDIEEHRFAGRRRHAAPRARRPARLEGRGHHPRGPMSSRAATRRSRSATASSSSARRRRRGIGARSSPGGKRVDDVVIFGGGRTGPAIAGRS